jgi:F-type H+-transporting ATPase subunit delta
LAEVATIARPYAEAAFAFADKANALGAWSKTLGALAVVAADRDMQEAIGNPKYSTDQIYGLVASVSGDMSKEAQNFLRLLIENGRVALLPQIREQFEELKNEREGVVDAVITSAMPLEPAQVAALVADLEKRFKRKINPLVSVDKELIGGVRVLVGDEVIDGSVRGKLAAMTTGLMSS